MSDVRKYETGSSQKQWNTLATVANLYYNSGLTQNQIADMMYTSRSKISRMLSEARELGIVEIRINEPWDRNETYEHEIQRKFGMQTVRVIRQRVADDEEEALKDISRATAFYLDSILKPGMTVGISWGTTLYHITRRIRENNPKNIPVTVIPIMGAVMTGNPEKDSADLAKNLAVSYGGKYRYIYAPVYVQSREIRNSLLQDESISSTLELARKADVILTSIGSAETESWGYRLGGEDRRKLIESGAIGHIAGHFYNIRGEQVSTEYDDRMVGLELDEISRCPNVICGAVGRKKALALIGAMNGRRIMTLIVDEECAEEILRLSDGMKDTN